eukprot:GHVS01020105.1.p1 GENE.GHVS01020105.1~~GHVS01020105.1.p1  ORF type:complete len:600 (+),score=108.43 GHVS01020105.1:163-1962(+)
MTSSSTQSLHTAVVDQTAAAAAALAEKAWQLCRDSCVPFSCEPPRMWKSQWDFVCQEMTWMAVDVAEERKWKVFACRRACEGVREHWQRRKRDHHRWATQRWAAAVQSFWLGVVNQSLLSPPSLTTTTTTVVKVPALWDTAATSQGEINATREWEDARVRACELAIHQYQERGSTVHSLDYRPPHPELDRIIPPAMSCSWDDHLSRLVLYLFVCSADLCHLDSHRKRKRGDTSLRGGLHGDQSVTSDMEPKKKSRRKQQRMSAAAATPPPLLSTAAAACPPPPRLNGSEIAILDLLMKTYGRAERGRRVVNWDLVAQALNTAMVGSGGYESRTARQLEQLYSARQNMAAHDCSVSLAMQYKPKVYGYAPRVAGSCTRHFPLSAFRHPMENCSAAFAEMPASVAGLQPPPSASSSLPPPLPSSSSASSGSKGSMLKVIRGLCDTSDKNISALSLLMTKSTKHNILLDDSESRSLKQLCNLVCGYGNIMRKQMAAHQNLYETFHLRELLSTESDSSGVAAQIPVHPSHARVSQLAASLLQHRVPPDDTAEEVATAGGSFRSNPNCSMQVVLAEVTRDRLKQLPSVLNPFPRPRKPALPNSF